MLQKIIKVGNSFAITIPKEFMKDKKWKAGESVYVDKSPDGSGIMVQKEQRSSQNVLTPAFKNWLDAFNKKYKPALTELAKK